MDFPPCGQIGKFDVTCKHIFISCVCILLQMIANHKQEVELMNLLREKEKERQKYSLANKVAQRKRKRMARKAEMMEKEGLKHGKVCVKCTPPKSN